jgi:hypothetical protein
MVVLILILAACLLGVGAGLLTALAVWLAVIFKLLDALVQQVPRGVMLFLRLATWLVVRSLKLTRYVWLHSRRVGVWTAQVGYVQLFVWSFLLREWYVSNELRKRNAH